jgi:hypothetical protein
MLRAFNVFSIYIHFTWKCTCILKKYPEPLTLKFCRNEDLEICWYHFMYSEQYSRRYPSAINIKSHRYERYFTVQVFSTAKL